MAKHTKDVQKRYDGFLKTPCLWKKDVVCNLNQFEVIPKFSKIDLDIDDKLRLGKYIERLVSFELSQNNTIKILAENLQIQDGKTTLGEIDCLLLQHKKPIHLEIIYKFYVYDVSVGTSEIDHFIGPNRKDALNEKLKKLSEKQLPLLYSKSCESYLEQLNLNASEMEQQVYFKAQLFIPFGESVNLEILNPDCVVGFYVKMEYLSQFSDCKFYIPKKIDWIIVPHTQVDWLGFSQFKEVSFPFLERQFSPMFWLKYPNGTLRKCFLIWW